MKVDIAYYDVAVRVASPIIEKAEEIILQQDVPSTKETTLTLILDKTVCYDSSGAMVKSQELTIPFMAAVETLLQHPLAKVKNNYDHDDEEDYPSENMRG